MSWRMPSETAPQTRTWMAYPSAGYSLGDTAEEHHAARATWAAVANAIVDFQPVTVVVDPAEREAAGRYLSSRVDVVEAPLDDAWMRDIGPTFVVDEAGRLGAVDWIFNGWGGQDWTRWDRDGRIGRFVAELAGAEYIGSELVGEGGGLHVDGAGTVLLTDTVQLDPGRNPGWTKRRVEAEMQRTIGATHAVWLPYGLTRDYDTFGTRGHVDIVATIPSPGTVLLHDQRDPAHPDHERSAHLRDVLAGSTDAAGRAFEVVPVPAPTVLRDDEGFVDYSYINHVVVNDAVVACSFDDPHDGVAVEALAAAYPGREIVTVDARPLFARGGGIHCITQQQPAV
ncbi:MULTISPECIES: agmatine/peptidylarginine deiminase [Tsukamurella]|uniref:Agmatine deiminase family protein n=2 Tax=Tsukamurella TaxID=2060 RepID=A0A5C5RYZ6_9ACTN|nr:MULTISPECIES: agmatine deiminase family protein [Tsukamurella]NMD57044.1 agmatine deiminase family protein [Tsukamurella columbiensis]TWS27723.1 agmatine deiminase family protein [Tsukamurella conjunctivitidis]